MCAFSSLFTVVLFVPLDVFGGAWEWWTSSYSSGVDFKHQHLP